MAMVTVAAAQVAPVFCHVDATLDKLDGRTQKAASDGAGLIVFPEAFLPGYPDWVWRDKPWTDDRLFTRWLDAAVEVPGPAIERVGRAARAPRKPDGTYLGKHRKVIPTGGERLVGATRTGRRLPVVDAGFGRVGGLLCWENYIPPARAAMYAQGIDVWVAPTWDCSEKWVATMRHIAEENTQFVIGVGQASAEETSRRGSRSATSSTTTTMSGSAEGTR